MGSLRDQSGGIHDPHSKGVGLVVLHHDVEPAWKKNSSRGSSSLRQKLKWNVESLRQLREPIPKDFRYMAG